MTKLNLTRKYRKELKRPGELLKVKDFQRVQLTAKETKHYRNLIIKKLESMNVVNEVNMVATNQVRTVKYFDQKEMKVKTARLPLNRLANLQKSLTRRLLKLSKSEVERFLSQVFEEPVKESPVQIKDEVNVVTEANQA